MTHAFTHAAPMLLAAALSTPAPVAMAQAAVPAHTQPPSQGSTLSYDLDFALAYVDRLSSLGGEAALEPALSLDAAAMPRAMGLRRLRLATDWQSPRGASLHVVLRPDALNRSSENSSTLPVRDMDTRAGDSYRPAPTIRMLDAYYVSIAPAASLSGSIGVFEELAPRQRAYPELLGHGLAVSLPTKFSALRLRWRTNATPPAAAGNEPSSHVLAGAYILQGHEDRVEALLPSTKSFDTAPAAADPYLGGAGYLTWTPTKTSRLNVIAGTLDAKEAGGRRGELFGSLAAGNQWHFGGVETRTNLDIRYARETWRGTPMSIKGRTQHSEELTAAARIGLKSWLLAGLSYGASERALNTQTPDQLTTVTGYQIETGVISTVANGLDLQFMLSHERRTAKHAGGTEAGAFVDQAGDHATVRRLGLELRYLLHDNT